MSTENKDMLEQNEEEVFSTNENIETEEKQSSSAFSTSKAKKNIKTLWLFIISAAFICIAFFIALVMCNYISNRNFRETFYSVSSLKVENTVRILQISDLHSCSYGENNDKMIERIEKLAPDVILCTGDIIDAKRMDLEKTVQLCTKLSEIAPSYYVYGNNEVDHVYGYTLLQGTLDEKFGFDETNRNPSTFLEIKDDYEEMLENAGITVLKNEVATVKVEDTDVDIFGVLNSNPSSFWTYAGEYFESFIYNDPEHLKVMAIHEPFIFEEFDFEDWGDLIVCGHTHGGTARVPVFGPLYTREGGILPERSGYYVYGRYNVTGSPIVVSSGLENTNIFRLNNQPEIVIIDINKF